MLEGGFRGEPKRSAEPLQAQAPSSTKKARGVWPRAFLLRATPYRSLDLGPRPDGFDGYDLRNWSNERDTWVLIGSLVSAAILVESALISFPWLSPTSSRRAVTR